EEPRKRTKWMLDAISKAEMVKDEFSVTLVGNASQEFQEWVLQKNLNLTFRGYVAREELLSIMSEHDIFLFGSCLDDWGYVLIEAMSQGLCVIAPDLSPFDEIVGDPSLLYSPYSTKDFIKTVEQVISDDLQTKRRVSWERAQQLFSRKAFGRTLEELQRKSNISCIRNENNVA
ncbi:MAG: glycosyltransferase family 4 protein, partial [Anaerolineae bacterium]|nr:glycosyltransferase family 4 protein [Anaerolineae bacterium]